MNEDQYLQGLLLLDALFEYSDPTLIDDYKKSSDYNFSLVDKKEITEDNWINFFSNSLNELQKVQNINSENKIKLKKIKNSLIQKLINGGIIAYGYQLPRKIEDIPVKIPKDFFLSEKTNWDKSNINHQGIDFTGIRIFKNENTQIEIELKKEEQNNKNFKDYDPDFMIDEKEAALFLGFKVKTLQGWRHKGGGPEYHKIGNKAVRYKINDLKLFLDNKKKRNTYE